MIFKKSTDKLNNKLKKSHKLTKIIQMTYITCSNYQTNNLWESASACSFGFIFSFIPLTLIIIAVLTGLLKISPGIHNWILRIVEAVTPYFDITPFFNNLMENKAIHWVDILLGFWVIWMARKMFLSILQAITKIFRSESPRKTWFNQLFIFILEFTIVFLIAAVIIAAFVLNQILSSNIFTEDLIDFIPSFINHNSHNLLTLIMYSIIFISTVCIFKISSGTHPSLISCIIFGFLSNISFFIISWFLDKFMNLTNYNIIYGTISTLVILIMKVYIFFVIFLFFAQMIYVNQFLDILLRSQIYLLPSDDVKGILNTLRRVLFINPVSLKTKENTLTVKAGETVYSNGDRSNCVYYIRSGTICEAFSQRTIEYQAGDFFGDTQCILKQPRISNAIAKEDTKLIVFSAIEFNELIQRSPNAASKAVTKIVSTTDLLFDK